MSCATALSTWSFILPTASLPNADFSLPGLGVTAVIASIPFLIVAATSFIKIALVLAILRSALGAPGVPPTSVLTALAAVLSLFVMAPVGDEMLSAIQSAEVGPVKEDPWGIESARSLCSAAAPPLMAFLKANTPPSEVDFFLSLAGELPGSEAGFRVLLPAFATGEIVDAFVIGFLIYLPFLVIDLIVSTVLLTLGMHMLSPTGISLPLKLLLFIIVDGWHVLLSGIVVNYA